MNNRSTNSYQRNSSGNLAPATQGLLTCTSDRRQLGTCSVEENVCRGLACDEREKVIIIYYRTVVHFSFERYYTLYYDTDERELECLKKLCMTACV